METLPEPQTDFVFTVTGEGTLWPYALIAAAVVAGFLTWRRLRKQRNRE